MNFSRLAPLVDSFSMGFDPSGTKARLAQEEQKQRMTALASKLEALQGYTSGRLTPLLSAPIESAQGAEEQRGILQQRRLNELTGAPSSSLPPMQAMQRANITPEEALMPETKAALEMAQGAQTEQMQTARDVSQIRDFSNVLGDLIQQDPQMATAALGAFASGDTELGKQYLTMALNRQPSGIEQQKLDLSAERLAVQKAKEDRQAGEATRRDINAISDQAQKYTAQMDKIWPVISGLMDVDETLTSMGVNGGLFGASNESLDRFAGKFTKPVRGFLFGSSNDPDEQAFRAAISRYFNKTLKERSGAAVVENELNRLQAEYGLDVWGSPAALLSALQKDARVKVEQAKGYTAAISPEYRDEILSRPGIYKVPARLSENPAVDRPQSVPSAGAGGAVPNTPGTAPQEDEFDKLWNSVR